MDLENADVKGWTLLNLMKWKLTTLHLGIVAVKRLLTIAKCYANTTTELNREYEAEKTPACNSTLEKEADLSHE